MMAQALLFTALTVLRLGHRKMSKGAPKDGSPINAHIHAEQRLQ